LDSPRRLSHLNVRGNDLLSVGIKGEKIGKQLNDLLYLVATNRLKNKKEVLIKYALKND